MKGEKEYQSRTDDAAGRAVSYIFSCRSSTWLSLSRNLDCSAPMRSFEPRIGAVAMEDFDSDGKCRPIQGHVLGLMSGNDS